MIAGALEIQLFADVARIRNDMDAARRTVDDATTRMSKAAGIAMGALGAMAGAMSIGAFASMIKGSIDAVDSLTDLSTRTRMTVEELAGLSFGAKLSGTELEAAASSITKLSVNIGNDTEKFAKLGITAKEPIEAFKQLAEIFAAIKDPQEQAAFGARYLGKSWQDSAVLLNEGSAGIAELMRRGLELSGVTTKISADAAQFNDKLDEIGAVAAGAGTRIAAELLPLLNRLTNTFLDFVTSSSVREFGSALVAAVSAISAALGPALKIATAYFAVFIAAPAIFAAMTAALTPVIGAVAIYTMNVMIGQTATLTWSGALTVLNTSLFGTAMAANTAAGGLYTLRTAGAVMFAAFAGWQIGSYLREEFVEARVAGLAFVGVMMKGWEHVKYGAEMAWEGIRFAWDRVVGGMKTSFAAYLSMVAAGMSAVGATDTAKQINTYAEGMRQAAAAQKTFAEQTAGVTAAHIGAIAAIDEGILDLVSYELSVKGASTTEAAAVKSKASFTAAAEAQAKAINGAANAQNDFIRALEKQVAELGLTASAIKLNEAAALGLTGARMEHVRALLAEIDAYDAAKKRAEEMDRIEAEYTTTLGKTVEEAMREADANEELVRTFGLSKSAIELLTIARLEEKLVRIDAIDGAHDEAAALGLVIDARKRSVAAMASLDALEAGKKVADENLKSQQSMWDSIDQTAHDTFVSIFDSGKSAFDRLKDTLKNGLLDMLYQMTIKKWILNISGQVTGGTGGGLMGAIQSAAGGGAGGAGGIAGILSIGKTLFQGLSGMSSIAGALGPIALGVGAAVMLGKSLFGMKDKVLGATTLNGSFGASGFTGSNDTAWTQKGGLFRSDKSGVNSAAIDAAMAAQFTSGYDALKTASADFAKALGVNADSIAGRSQAMSIVLTKDETENKRAIATFFTGVADDMARELIPSLDKFTVAGESASATLQRIAGHYVALDQVLGSLSMTFGAIGMESIEARERLVSLSGGIEAMAQQAQGFAQNFLSEAERLVPVQKYVTDEMAAMGLAGVTTREQFKSIVLGLTLTDEKGAETYARLMKLQDAFAMVTPAAEDAAVAVAALAEKEAQRAEVIAAQAKVISTAQVAFMDSMNRVRVTSNAQASSMKGYFAAAANNAIQSAAKTKTAWQGLSDSVFDEVQRIRGVMSGNGAEGFAEAQARFATATAQARAGDQQAFAILPKLSQALLMLAENNATSVVELQQFQNRTATSLYDTGMGAADYYGLTLPGFTNNNTEFLDELRQQRAENSQANKMLEAHLYAIAKFSSITADIQEKHDSTGIPETRAPA